MVLSSRSVFVAEFITRARELGERNDLSLHHARTLLECCQDWCRVAWEGGWAKCLWRFLPNRKGVGSAMFRLRCCVHSNMSLLTERKKDSECTP